MGSDGRTERKVEEKNKLYAPLQRKLPPSKPAGTSPFPGEVGSFPGLLYVSWFRKVGDERYHHPHVHPSADGDGEGGEKQGASGGDVGQWEITFVHRLGCLKETMREESQKQFRAPVRNKKNHNDRSSLSFLRRRERNKEQEHAARMSRKPTRQL